MLDVANSPFCIRRTTWLATAAAGTILLFLLWLLLAP
jgi:hypothetical protein